jgi:hypothetical protein
MTSVSDKNNMTFVSSKNNVLKSDVPCPIFKENEIEFIGSCEFDFTEDFYKTFQEFMFQNPGKTSEELCNIITFYKFEPDTLEVAFKMFNTWKNTFWGKCGPFIYKNERWFPVYSKKYIDKGILAQENSELRQKIKELEANRG